MASFPEAVPPTEVGEEKPHDSTHQKHTKPEPTEHEKELLAAYEGHDADIPSNEGYVLDERGELRRLKSMQRRHSMASRKSHNAHDSTGDVEKGADDAAGSESSTDSQYIVWWDGDDDPANPMNWAQWKKVANFAPVAMLCFVSPLASSMFAPGVPELMDEFNSTSKTLGSFVVSVFLLGFAFGPLILAPLSELYGRLVVYHATNIGFLVFNVACAEAPNLSTLIAMRFLAGCMGAACITNGGGTVADLIPQQKRGLFMALFAMGPLLGPVVGPVAGGYIAESIGWRWTFWILVCLTGAFSIVSLIFLRETYAPVIIERKAARLRKETGNNEYRSKLDVGLSKKDVFTMSIVRPMKLLLFSPIVMILSLYLGVLYGYMYLLFTTFTVVFTEQYGFSSGSVGLSFLGIGIGSLVGLGLIGGLSDRLLKSRARANSPPGTPDAELNMKPEYRLPMLQPFAILVVGGLFLYGWTAEYKVHWIVPILGTGIVGACMMVAMMCIQTYLVDAFTIYAASAIAANTVIRSMLGALLPLAGQDMYAALGLGWGNSLLAFIALAMAWVPWALGRWGETIRTKYPVKL